MRKDETDRFEAEADDGERCTIVEYTAKVVRKAATSCVQLRLVQGDRNYVTSAGRPIAPISHRHFRDVLSTKMFTRIDA